jgi:hypothetical protein
MNNLEKFEVAIKQAYNSSSDYIERLRSYFKNDALVYNPYWRTYDKVIQFHYDGWNWDVDVIECHETGEIKDGACVRNHCTNPFWEAKIYHCLD